MFRSEQLARLTTSVVLALGLSEFQPPPPPTLPVPLPAVSGHSLWADAFDKYFPASAHLCYHKSREGVFFGMDEVYHEESCSVDMGKNREKSE
ncbi:MAG: hypothetical protein M1609_04305, partial [Firmicutes bacterium]|nr:hypothetical protein [Bacillota bacterium]